MTNNIDMMDEVIQLPYDLASEESVLGSLLIDDMVITTVLDILTPCDFYRDKNQWVMEACKRLYDRNEMIDYTLVASELDKMGRLDDIGGADYLGYLIHVTPTSVHCEYYANAVKRLSILRQLTSVGEKIQKLAYEDYGASEAIAKAMEYLLSIANDNDMQGGYESIADIVGDSYSVVCELLDSNFVPGITTGYHKLNMAIGGYQKGKLYLLAGRPGMGKTQLMLQQAYRISDKGHGVGIVSLEMPNVSLMNRLIFSDAGINEQQLRIDMMTNKVSMEQRDQLKTSYLESCGKLTVLPLYIDDKAGQTTSRIRTRVMSLIHKTPISILFVDHLGLTKDKGENEVKRLDEISQALKDMAKDLNIPVVVLCQLNRALETREDKRPRLNDLRGSGALEQNSDVVLGLYRPYYYNQEVDNPYTLEILYLKNRDGAGGTMSDLYYDARTGIIKDEIGV